MKKNYIILSAIILSAGVFSFQKSGSEKIGKLTMKHNLYLGGVSAATGNYAGAPGDNNCTFCHTGSTLSGSSINTIVFASGMDPVTSYEPGQTYNIALTMTPNPTKKGFQAVAMNSSNQIVGTFGTVTMGGATVVGNRATHTSSSNTSSNSVWAWSWTAPSTDQGDVTLYVATMSANNNGGTSGDLIYLSQHIIGSSAGIKEVIEDKYNFSSGYSSSNNAVVMDFNSLVAGEMYFNLVDLNGRSVFTYKMGTSSIGSNHEKIALPEELKNGMYVVNMFVNNNAMSQKIMIQK